jgi:hypothetical protein
MAVPLWLAIAVFVAIYLGHWAYVLTVTAIRSRRRRQDRLTRWQRDWRRLGS